MAGPADAVAFSSHLSIPTSSITPASNISAFLKALNGIPGSPRVCPSIVSFSNTAHKANWYCVASTRQHVTYSFAEKLALQGAENRLFYFNHAPGTWVGGPNGIWTAEDWHAWGVALIKTPGTIGLTMVIYDVDCVLQDEGAIRGQTWEMKTPSLHHTFWAHVKEQRHVHKVFYSQNVQHRGQGRCLRLSLKWLKMMAMLGDQEFSVKDWKAAGFNKI